MHVYCDQPIATKRKSLLSGMTIKRFQRSRRLRAPEPLAEEEGYVYTDIRKTWRVHSVHDFSLSIISPWAFSKILFKHVCFPIYTVVLVSFRKQMLQDL